MSIENLHALLGLYRSRFQATELILKKLHQLSVGDPEATILEKQKWAVRLGQETAMIERLERRLGIRADDVDT